MPRYEAWKQSHNEDAAQVGHFMAFYSPRATIRDEEGKKMSLDSLRNLAVNMRNAGTFSSARDQKPLEWAQNAAGDRVELLAFHCYGDDGGNLLNGQRLLTWRRSGGKWLIVRDDFPPRYFVSK